MDPPGPHAQSSLTELEERLHELEGELLGARRPAGQEPPPTVPVARAQEQIGSLRAALAELAGSTERVREVTRVLLEDHARLLERLERAVASADEAQRATSMLHRAAEQSPPKPASIEGPSRAGLAEVAAASPAGEETVSPADPPAATKPPPIREPAAAAWQGASEQPPPATDPPADKQPPPATDPPADKQPPPAAKPSHPPVLVPAAKGPPVAGPPRPGGRPAAGGSSRRRRDGGKPRSLWRRMWPRALAAFALLLAAGAVVYVLSRGDAADGPGRQAAAQAAGVRLAVAPGLGSIRRALRGAAPVREASAASASGALQDVCAGRADAALLAEPATGSDACDDLDTVAVGAAAATIPLARETGCVDAARARELADGAGALDTRRRAYLKRRVAAARAATVGPRTRKLAARRAHRDALADFDARNGLAPLRARDDGGRCVSPTRATIASGAWPLVDRLVLVARPGARTRGVAAALRRSAARAPITTVAIGPGA